MAPRTLYEKIWDKHTINVDPELPSLVYIDRHIVHDVSAQAFAGIEAAGRTVRRPDLTLAVVDHTVPTTHRELPVVGNASVLLSTVDRNCRHWGIRLFDLKSQFQGIVHIIGPELGFTQPGLTVACGDSHSSTHGALGCLPFGFGVSEVEHILATQCLWRKKSQPMLVRIEGTKSKGVSAKDLVLAVIGKIGIGGGVGHVIEYAGQAMRDLSLEGRMTVCNMSIEAGAVSGLIAPDKKTAKYLEGRPFTPRGKQFDEMVASWSDLVSDDGASFNTVVELDAAEITPQVTWGTNPGMVTGVTGTVPDPGSYADPQDVQSAQAALDYMGLRPGMSIKDIDIDHVFIGSCANSRIEDLRIAARVVEGKKICSRIKQAMVVPGSMVVKAQAESEGLDEIFKDAGFEWHDAGCSMCVGMNGDLIPAGSRCASTSNRNFEGRQGKGARTHLVSPMMAAAAALAGHFVDTRELDVPDDLE